MDTEVAAVWDCERVVKTCMFSWFELHCHHHMCWGADP